MEVIEAEPYQIIVKSFSNILQKIYKLEKLNEDVMTIKFDSNKRCDIFTKTQKLGGSTAVFRNFPFKNNNRWYFGNDRDRK